METSAFGITHEFNKAEKGVVSSVKYSIKAWRGDRSLSDPLASGASRAMNNLKMSQGKKNSQQAIWDRSVKRSSRKPGGEEWK